jgi:hypothetical protein
MSQEDRYLEPWECSWHIIPCTSHDECEELLADMEEGMGL